MDFAFTQEQEALARPRAQILTDHATHERLQALERDGQWLDRDAVARARPGEPARRGAPRGVRRQRARPPRALSAARAGRPHRRAGAGARVARARRAADRARSAAPRSSAALLPGIAGGDGIVDGRARRARRERSARAGDPRRARRRHAGASTATRLCVPPATLATHVLVPARATPAASGSSSSTRAARASRSSAQVLTQRRAACAGSTLAGARSPATPLGDPAGGAAVARLARASAPSPRSARCSSASATARCA